MKYLEINFTKCDQDSYTENYKTFLREIREGPSKWREILGSWVGELNVIIDFAQIYL